MIETNVLKKMMTTISHQTVSVFCRSLGICLRSATGGTFLVTEVDNVAYIPASVVHLFVCFHFRVALIRGKKPRDGGLAPHRHAARPARDKVN